MCLFNCLCGGGCNRNTVCVHECECRDRCNDRGKNNCCCCNNPLAPRKCCCMMQDRHEHGCCRNGGCGWCRNGMGMNDRFD